MAYLARLHIWVSGEILYASDLNSEFNNITNNILVAPASPVQGDLYFNNGIIWTRLPAGTSGQLLRTQGNLANPKWDNLLLGDIPASVTFPSGTKMSFYQDTAPTGWTIQDTLDDKLVYITKGSAAGGQAGGTVHPSGTWTVSGISGASHTLTVAEMPAHTHPQQSTTILNQGGGPPAVGAVAGTLFQGGVTQSTGGGEGHSHTVSSDGTWRPSAYCFIIAQKN
jgi:hypothetical protein